jgi:hypothetical protein
VDDHLVALARRAGIDAVMQRRLGQQAHRIRLLLGHCGRLRGNVRRKRFRGNVLVYRIGNGTYGMRALV